LSWNVWIKEVNKLISVLQDPGNVGTDKEEYQYEEGY
jgi:hypothetical protein